MSKKLGLVINNKNLMLDWDSEKNNADGLDPNFLTCGSTKTAHWKCHVCGNEFTTRIERKNKGSKCKKCLANELTIAPKEKSLAFLYPDLAKEWSKKNTVSPDTVYPQSNLKYWWVCPKGHDDYEMEASKRTGRRAKCPVCSNHKVVPGINDLATTYPKLLREWDWELNNSEGLYPTEISYGNKNKANWICQRGHRWRAAVYSRTTGHCNCPKCSKELKTSYPEKIIAFYISSLFKDTLENYHGKELNRNELDVYIPSLKLGIEYDGSRWHKNLKKDLSKDELCDKLGIFLIRVREKGCIEYESNSLKIYINEKNDQELVNAIQLIIQTINEKYDFSLSCDIDIDRDGSTIISNVLTIIKKNSVASTEFADEWDNEKNKNINLEYVSKFSNKRYWWLCKNHKHSWRALVSDRAKGNGCPFCSGQRVLAGFNDLEFLYPEVAKEWDYELNKKKPNEVTSKTTKQYHWICSKCGNHWKTQVYIRTALGGGCPECAKTIISEKNTKNAVKRSGSLAKTNPILAKEFHPTRNGKITPNDITANYNGDIIWKCSKCGYEWSAAPSSRNQGAGCPHCSGRVPMPGVDDLFTINPDLCKEWDYSKNKILPSEVLPGSGEKVWWICSKCGNNWPTEIKVRGIMGCGCPKCGHLKTAEASYKKIRNIETGKIYKSITEATKELGLSRTSISNCLSGRAKTAGGYHWEYID